MLYNNTFPQFTAWDRLLLHIISFLSLVSRALSLSCNNGTASQKVDFETIPGSFVIVRNHISSESRQPRREVGWTEEGGWMNWPLKSMNPRLSTDQLQQQVLIRENFGSTKSDIADLEARFRRNANLFTPQWWRSKHNKLPHFLPSKNLNRILLFLKKWMSW